MSKIFLPTVFATGLLLAGLAQLKSWGPNQPFSKKPSLATEINCESLSKLEHAHALTPNDFRLVLSVARVQSELKIKQVTCNSKPVSSERIYQLLARAELLAPNSAEQRLSRAGILLQLGKRQEAFEVLRLSQEEDRLLPATIEKQLFDLPQSSAELDQLLPRRFPQLAHWISHYQNNRLVDFSVWSQVFAEKLGPAIENALAKKSSRKVEKQNLEKYLRDTWVGELIPLNDSARKKLDLALGDSLDPKAVREFLKARGALDRSQAIYGENGSDLDPANSPISFTMPNLSGKTLRLDRNRQSIGLQLLSTELPRVIVLQSRNSSSPFKLESLELLSSQDNLNYETLPAEALLNAVIHGRQVIVFKLSEKPFRYLKLHYRGFSEDADFSNSARSLVQLYAEATLTKN